VFRADTSQLPGLYPFLHARSLPPMGAYIGWNTLSMQAFSAHPAAWVLAGIATNPNVLVTGIPGAGKSANVKALSLRLMPFGVRTLIAGDFAAAFEQADVLISPTAPTTAFRIGEKMADPVAMYRNDIATIPANLAGVPGLSLPSGIAEEDGLPVGIQVLAPATQDQRMYAVGAALQARLAELWGGSGSVLDRAPDVAALAAARQGVSA